MRARFTRRHYIAISTEIRHEMTATEYIAQKDTLARLAERLAHMFAVDNPRGFSDNDFYRKCEVREHILSRYNVIHAPPAVSPVLRWTGGFPPSAPEPAMPSGLGGAQITAVYHDELATLDLATLLAPVPHPELPPIDPAPEAPLEEWGLHGPFIEEEEAQDDLGEHDAD